jgi:methionine synthase / methylenetetrahydrofolate reductase(NADPH)
MNAPGDNLRAMIADGRVHVMDGAMGTLLYSRGVFVNVCYDELNVEQPHLVQEVHAEYVRAGAEIIETNTFGANPVKLSSFGLAERTEEINRAAVALALAGAEDASGRSAKGRGATGDAVGTAGRSRPVAVVGAIGPLGIRIEPFGPTAMREAVDFFRRQVIGLLEGGVDGFILETFSDMDELKAAFTAVKELSDLPVFAQLSVGESGNTSYGTSPEAIARALTEWGVDVVGLNCSVGPATMLDAIERMAEVTDLPLSAQPNAGLPRAVRDRKIYLASPEYMAQYARRMIEAGARFVGGCCGTTPEHVKKIRDHVASVQPRHPQLVSEGPDESDGTGGTGGGVRAVAGGAPRGTDPDPVQALPGAREPVPLRSRSRWGARLAAGDFATSLEIIPPRGWDAHEMIEQCRVAQRAGFDAVNVVDSPRGQSRMSPVAAALIIEREVRIETIMHYTCRDRNMLGMMSDLLGAAAAGLRNVLIVSGDPPTTGPYPDSTAVFDIDSIGLTNVVHRLNRGLDPGGNPIGTPTEFVIGVAINQGAVDLEREASRLAWKVQAGAEFAVTQPVFDAEALEAFLERTRESRVPVIAGIWPLVSLRNAEFLANEVPGVRVPKRVVERMRGAQEKGAEAAAEEGVRIAREILTKIRGMVQGVHLSAPGGNTDAALAVLGALGGPGAAEERRGLPTPPLPSPAPRS